MHRLGSRLLAPACWLLDRLRLGRKLALIGVILVAAAVFATWRYAETERRQIAFSSAEVVGVEYVGPLEEIASTLITQRSLAVRLATGDRTAAAGLAGARRRTATAIDALTRVDRRHGGPLQARRAWTRLLPRLRGSGAIAGTPRQVYTAYDPLVDGVLAEIVDAANRSNLILDPDLDSFYVMDALITKLPVIANESGRIADLERVLDHEGDVAVRDRIAFALAQGAIQTNVTAMQAGFATAVQSTADPRLGPAIRPPAARLAKATAALDAHVGRVVAGRIDAGAARRLDTAVAGGAGALGRTALPQLRALLDARIATLRADMRHTILICGLAILLASYLFLALFVRVTGTTRRMNEAAGAIAAGDVDQQLDARGRDEFGELAASFNRMSDYLRDSAGVARTIAGGDLTVEVRPRSERDVLGLALAEMVTRLRSVVGRVSRSATELGTASYDMANTSEEASRAVEEIALAIQDVAVGAGRQQETVRSTREATERILDASRASAERAQATSEAGADTAAATEDGLAAVTAATDAMRKVRIASDEAGVTIRTLGAKSSEIGGIVATISGIAEQTNLLALNAAIEAAHAGEQGRGFAVVADEVRKLAEESREATTTITGLIADIQHETLEAVRIVAGGAELSEAGDATVAEAAAAFARIGVSVGNMREQVAEIEMAIVEVTAGADAVGVTIGEVGVVADASTAQTETVSASTEQTSASAQQIAASARDLQRTADELGEAVGEFQLA